MTARARVLLVELAFLGLLVAWNIDSVHSCMQSRCQRVRIPSFFEINQTPVAGFGVKCRASASKSNSLGLCPLNITRFIPTVRQTKKTLIFYFHVRCDSPTRVALWNSNHADVRKNAVSYLIFSGPCLVSWEDAEAFGNITDLRVLYMMRGATFVNRNFTFHGPRGVANVGTVLFQNQNLHGAIPKPFQQGVWRRMAEVNFSNISLEVVPVHTLQKTMPFLQSLEVTYNRLKKPPKFPWCTSVLKLPRNLRRTFIGNQHYGLEGQIQPDIYRRFLLLDHNRITNLSTYEFTGYLHKLSLKGNGLQVIGRSCFRNVTGMLSLDMSHNSLRQLPLGVFESLESLVELRLDFNNITNVSSDVFKEIINLKSLYLSRNKLREIPRGLLSKQNNLEVVHLEGNGIKFMSERSFPESDSTALKEVYLSKNNLRIFPVWALLSRNLELADLSNNELTFRSFSEVVDSIDLDTLYYQHRESASSLERGLKTKKKTLKLSNNKFETVNIDGFNQTKLAKFEMVLRVFVIDLEGNPLLCRCGMLATQRWLLKVIKEHDEIDKTNFNTWKCSGPGEVKGKNLIEVQEQHFTCQRKFAKCPRNCDCSVRSVDKAVNVDCRGRNLTKFPVDLPKGVLELHFENNQIEMIPSFAFLGRITGLYLSHNIIKRLNGTSLLGLTNIRGLYLDNNKLTELPKAIRKVRFTRLSLQNNFLKCDCYARWIKYWLMNVTQRVVAIRDIRCNTGEAQGKALIDVDDDDFTCDNTVDEARDTQFYEKTIFKNISFALAALLLLTAVMLAFLYKFRGEVKVFMFTHFNWHPFDRLDDADTTKIYDAFVSYSGHDHDWVWNILAEKLETRDPPYKLCIHDRDFEVGAPIAENILNSVEQSKRTIMVLSRNFVTSEWCLLEFRAAHRRVLEERMRYLIVILLEDLNTDELDSEIRLYMRTNTYLSSDDKWFWQKLFYAMPQNEKREGKLIEPMEGVDGPCDNSETCSEAEVVNEIEVTIVSGEQGSAGLCEGSDCAEFQDSYL